MKPLILTPGFGDNAPTASLYYGQDVRDTLQILPEASVHTVCTSPPYWGLRDYGTGDAQIGLEDTMETYVESLVEVFREIKRVLRDDGTVWLNLGDSYNGSGGAGGDYGAGGIREGQPKYKGRREQNLKPKDLAGIPWRVALALQADGWYLRQDIIWHKPNPMPESAQDRCTKAHEYVFLLTKSARYAFEQLREPSVTGERFHGGYDAVMGDGSKGHSRNGRFDEHNRTATRNKRSVWTIPTSPYPGSHFATWPPELVRPMILAGTNEKGCCSGCGAPYTRVVSRVVSTSRSCPKTQAAHEARGGVGKPKGTVGKSGGSRIDGYSVHKGWDPGCSCGEKIETPLPVMPCTVLDPFSGSATTGMVALQEGRNYIGIDLNADYLDLATARLEGRGAPKNPEPCGEPDIFELFGGGI
jgi:DNA modification methylase